MWDLSGEQPNVIPPEPRQPPTMEGVALLERSCAVYRMLPFLILPKL